MTESQGAPPPGYVEAVLAMAEAAKAWIVAHPYACLVLEPVNPDKLPIDEAQRAMLRAQMAREPGANIGIISDLQSAIDWWGGNEPTRELLRAMDRAAGDRRPTYTMAKCALELYVFPSQGAPS